MEEVATSPGHGQDARVSHQAAAPHRQLAKVGELPSQLSQSVVRHVALPHVQRPQPGAAVGEGEDGGVSDGQAAPGVEVAELVAVAHKVAQAGVRHSGTLGD